ncbi:unnamed protein product [Withania somnifera]
MGASKSLPQKSIHEFTVKDIKGKNVDLSIYKGKLLLVVNVASKCGLTSTNYTQLTELYNQFKDKVNGPNSAPVYKFLKASKGGFLNSSIKWNFTKFLVDKEGQVIRRYGSTTPPLSIKADIQKALGEN